MSGENFETALPVSSVRPLPNSPEAEQALLSCCFIEAGDVLSRAIMAGITPTHFYDGKHAIIFEVMIDVFQAQKPIATPIIAEELKTRRLIDEAGGFAYIGSLDGMIPTSAQAPYFIEKVKEQATLRAIIKAAGGVVENCYNYSGELERLTNKVSDDIMRAVGHGATRDEQSVQEVAKQMVEDLGKEPDRRDMTAFDVSWGLIDMDKSCGKMPAGGLVILAGMPSTGKSALADRIAWQTAERGSHVLIFTYEMFKRDKVIRVAQQDSRVSFKNYDESPLDMKMRFMTSLKRITQSTTLHVFENDKTIARVSARCKNYAQKCKVGLVVVDFLQYLARMEPSLDRERTDEKIGRITGELKQVAKLCQCPVLLLSSLNRSSYSDGQRPTLAGLKGSGEIESDGDVIILLHWPKTNPATGAEQDPHQGGASFYVEANQDKGRNSGVHQVPLMFLRDITTFENYHA